MSGRYKQRGRNDEATLVEGDAAFVGCDMRMDPCLLGPNMVAEAINYEFRQGVATVRRGFQTRRWAHELGWSEPWNDPWDADEALPFGKVYGACVFSDPYGQQRMILALEGISYVVAANAPFSTIPYPAGVTVTGEVNFTQAFNVLIMWRGEFANPLKLETTEDFSAMPVWEEVPDETNANYTATIPDASRGIHYGNRVWVHFDGNKVAYSDILVYTRYDPTFSTIYVNEGESDKLNTLFAFGENAILAFKPDSIYLLVDILPAPGLSSRVQTITHHRGCIAPDSIAQVGKDVVFLSDGGVYAISQALDNKLQAGTEAISAPLDPLFQRVNWAAAEHAQGIYHDAKYFLALPIDGANYNNVLAVYDFLTGRWAGHWTFAKMDVFRLLRMDVSGSRRLFIVSGDHVDAMNNGAIYMLGDGYRDERFQIDIDIETTLLTRGYTCGLTDQKLYTSAEVEVGTWFGAGELENVRDGVNEQGELVSFVKDRTKYNIWGKADYDPSNVNDDFDEPYRQDYSVELVAGGVDFADGIDISLHQLSSERMRIRQMGRHLQLRVNGSRGRVNVRAAAVAARATVESHRSKL